MRILIVEDDPAVAAGIADGLGAAAIEVDHVATGRAVLDTLATAGESGGHDLVVLDLGLPDMDGTDVCREIRARSAIPIIIVSARGDEMDRVLALELGADDYLVKPFGMRELLARIRAVTRRTAAVPEPEIARRSGSTGDRRAQPPGHARRRRGAPDARPSSICSSTSRLSRVRCIGAATY